MKKILIIISLVCITSCTKFGFGKYNEYNPFEGKSAQELYYEAEKEIAKEQYTAAIKRYEAMETMYPFNEHAEQAALHLISAYYHNGEFPLAAASAERFIHLYPRAKNVDYAYYMKGLANFQQFRGGLANLLPLDETWRDPGTQQQAYTDFSIFLQRFPESKYRANVLKRMIYLRNNLAKRELNIAQYYYERKKYVAAGERANYLIKTYPQAPSVQQALTISYNANMALGLVDAANDALLVYRATYHKDPDRIKV